MAESTKGISVDSLQHVLPWLLGADALKARYGRLDGFFDGAADVIADAAHSHGP